MRQMAVVFLVCSVFAFGQEREVTVESSTSPDGTEERVTAHFNESLPYSAQKQTVTRSVELLLSSRYTICKEIKNDVVQEGAGTFERGISTANFERLSYTLETDTAFHHTSSIKGDVTLLGVPDRVKAGCPSVDDEFPLFTREAPSTLKATQEALSHLPPEKVFSKRVSVSYPVDSPELAKSPAARVIIDIDPPYRACRVQSETFSLTGLGYFKRVVGTVNSVSYSYHLYPDTIFREPSGLVADLAIVGVLDREKAKCEPYNRAFFPFDKKSQHWGWVSKYRYISQNNPSRSNGGWSYGDVTATAPDGQFYCTHKVQINTQNGSNTFYPTQWSDTSFTLHYGVKAGSLFEHPASLGLTLYVRFLPDGADNSSCTARLAGHKPPGQGHHDPGNVWYWTPND
jgi:hypothetical protein